MRVKHVKCFHIVMLCIYLGFALMWFLADLCCCVSCSHRESLGTEGLWGFVKMTC